MTLPLIVTPQADADLADAYDWYEAKREGLGDRLVLCVEAALGHLRRSPKGSTEVYPGIRRVVVRQFPYGVFYRIDPHQIAVIAVYHCKRDPNGWQARA